MNTETRTFSRKVAANLRTIAQMTDEAAAWEAYYLYLNTAPVNVKEMIIGADMALTDVEWDAPVD